MVDGAIVLVDAAEGPDAADEVRGRQGAARSACARSSRSTRSTGRTRARSEVSTRCSTCSRRSTPPTSSSISRSSTAPAKQRLDGDVARRPEATRAWRRCSTSCSEHVPPPKVEEGPFRMLGTLLEANPFLGRIVTGPHQLRQSVKPNQSIKVLDRDGQARRDRAASPRSWRSAASSASRSSSARPATSSSIAGLVKGHGGRHVLRARGRRADAGAADRSADRHHDLHRQRQPARRHRGRQGDEPHDPRPPAARRPRATSRCKIEESGRQGLVLRRRAAANCSSPS